MNALKKGLMEFSALPILWGVLLCASSSPTAQQSQRYEKGYLGYFSSLLTKIISIVQRQTLPYYIINSVIEELAISNMIIIIDDSITNKPLSSTSSYLSAFLSWLTPTLVVVGIMLLGAALLPACCCSFFCLRTFGLCCANQHKTLHSHHNAKCRLSATLMLLLNISLLFGIVIGFLGTASFSLRNLVDNTDSAFGNGLDFLNDTISETRSVTVNQFEVVLSSVNSDLDNVSSILGAPIKNAIGPIFSPLMANFIQLLDELDRVRAEVAAVNLSIENLVDHSTHLNSTLLSLQESYDNFTFLCNFDVLCESTVPSAVPGVNSLDGLIDAVSLVNGSADIDTNATRLKLEDFAELFDSTLNKKFFIGLELLLNESVLSPIVSTLDSIQNSLETNGRELSDSIELVSAHVDRSETYKNIVGYGLYGVCGCLWSLFMCGLGLGVIGYRRGTEPHDRTNYSHYAAQIILIGIRMSFVMCSLLLVCSSLIYLSSTLFQKVCDDFSPPEYVFFANTIDNEELFGGETLLSALLGGQVNNSDLDLRITNIFDRCSNNDSLYQALQGNDLYNISAYILPLREMLMDNSLLGSVNSESIASFTVDELLPGSLRMSFQELPQSLNNSINFTDLSLILDMEVLAFSLEDTANDLGDLALIFDSINDTSSSASYVLNIRDNLLGNQINGSQQFIENEKDKLKMDLSSLETTLQNVLMQANVLLTSLDYFQNRTAALIDKEYFEFLDQLDVYFLDYLNYVQTAVEDDIGKCAPLVEAYSGLHGALCVNLLGGLNVMWLSICCIVLSSLLLVITGVMMVVFFEKPTDDPPSMASETSSDMSYSRSSSLFFVPSSFLKIKHTMNPDHRVSELTMSERPAGWPEAGWPESSHPDRRVSEPTQYERPAGWPESSHPDRRASEPTQSERGPTKWPGFNHTMNPDYGVPEHAIVTGSPAFVDPQVPLHVYGQ